MNDFKPPKLSRPKVSQDPSQEKEGQSKEPQEFHFSLVLCLWGWGTGRIPFVIGGPSFVDRLIPTKHSLADLLIVDDDRQGKIFQLWGTKLSKDTMILVWSDVLWILSDSWDENQLLPSEEPREIENFIIKPTSLPFEKEVFVVEKTPLPNQIIDSTGRVHKGRWLNTKSSWILKHTQGKKLREHRKIHPKK